MKALLTAAILSLACAMCASAAPAAGTGAERHHGKHTHVACTIKAKGKRHRRHATKRTHKCVRRTKHVKRSRSTGAGAQISAVSVAPSTAATIAKVLGTTCENTELMPEAGNLEAVDQATLCLVNQERARSGELPLRPTADLTQAAEGHSQEMVGDDYFAHISPSGETPFQRIEATGYIPNDQVGYTLGENIAWGTLYLATPKAIVAAWTASPEHLANILNTAYTETGMGVAPAAPTSLAEGQPGAIYSQEFGVIEG
ncbi:MAG: CAP domain-containing protein [Solirubrobacteraceae bacterium]